MHDHTHAQNRFAVIPTAEKLNADPELRGKGVTIAFLDSGFYPHPDIASRIIGFHDVAGAEESLEDVENAEGHHWHGTQTSVVCAGDGGLSDGIYRGIASKSNLVLVKVSDRGRITDQSIEKGLEWVRRNRERYGIRILNMSLGADEDLPDEHSRINQLAKRLADDGLVITVAAGNSPDQRPIPPGSSPAVITVGGYSDEDRFDKDAFTLYHSSFGTTIDGLVKPELIAPAMRVAAPILPETEDYKIAEHLSELLSAPDYEFNRRFNQPPGAGDIYLDFAGYSAADATRVISERLVKRKVVATHYQHVDGSSFAAPIAASVIAQMLEANPSLTPAAVKNILTSTASRLSGHPSVNQGFGIICARKAVELARLEAHSLESTAYHPPRIVENGILFCFHGDFAESVSLAGDFNGWAANAYPMEQGGDGIWRIKIPCLAPGIYQYKFYVDGRWAEDPSHGHKTDDSLGGFNSLLNII